MKFFRSTPVLSAIVAIILVSCNNDEPEPIKIVGISVITPPRQVEYYVGDSLDLSGLVVKLNMDNGTTEDISFSDFINKGITCSPENGDELTAVSTVVTITHAASGKSVIQDVTVIEKVAISISVKSPPKQVAYYVGEFLNLSGLVVSLAMDNGDTEDIAFSDFINKGITCFPINGEELTSASSAVTITHTATSITAKQAISVITLIDIEGNTYASVNIGNQLWMSENLKTTKYNDGTAIPLVTDNTIWVSLFTPAYCWYDNDEPTYSETYGVSYNWHTVETGKLCPSGWHVPTDSDWSELTNYLGANGYYSAEGKTLKASSGWNNGGNGTNDWRFTALPGGARSYDGKFIGIGENGYWWSSTEYISSSPWFRIMMYMAPNVFRKNGDKRSGLSVRCVRD